MGRGDHRARGLTGRIVAAVGLRYDEHMVEGVRMLNLAGARVALFDLGDAYGDQLAPEDLEPVRALLAEFPGSLAYVGELGGRSLRSHLWNEEDEDPWENVFEATRAAFGRPPETVWLGRWWGFIDAGLIPPLLDRLTDAGGGELIATEAAERCADQVVRWMHFWQDARDPSPVRTTVLREPGSIPVPLSGAGTAAELLGAAGWTPVTLAGAEALAADRRHEGLDALAGSRWGLRGMVVVENPSLVLGDAEALSAAGRAALTGRGDYEVFDLRTSGADGLLVRLPAEDAFGVAVTPPEGEVDGVCIQGTPDIFELDVAYRPLSILQIGSGVLTVGRPDEVLGTRNGLEVAIRPGPWAVEIARGDGETWAVRLRPYGEADRGNFPDEEDVGRAVVDFDEWGDPIFEGDTIIDWSTDPPILYEAGPGAPHGYVEGVDGPPDEDGYPRQRGDPPG